MKGWIITLLVILLTIPVALQGQEILTAAPTDTEVKILGKSKILEGPSILSIPGYFVWGGTVLKGPDGKYHMFYSIFEYGPGKLPFPTDADTMVFDGVVRARGFSCAVAISASFPFCYRRYAPRF